LKATAQRDHGTFTGFAIAGSAIAGGLLLGRTRISDLFSLNAILLVAGGTLAAVTFGTPSATLMSAVRRCRGLFRRQADNRRDAADQILRCATLSKRLGVSSMESVAEALDNGPLRRALLLVVDGTAPQEVRRQMEIDISVEEGNAESDARVFEQAGGYAPTIGIVGAVIGLIQVMRQLGDVDAVGRGIASAFTATLYGVALANLVLLPLAARIRARVKGEIEQRELILEGVIALGEGLSLRMIRTRLDMLLEPGPAVSLSAVSPVQAEKAERMTA
jgi:chemotaxis protein MotA